MDKAKSNYITLRPVGVVRSPVSEVAHVDWAEVVSEIHLDDLLTPGLLGLDAGGKITVVFYLDRAVFDSARDMVRHPRDRADLPLRGVFATRSQYRPNPIGVTDVELIGVKGNVLTVRGLDALDGTPVLDIKASALVEDSPDAKLSQVARDPRLAET